MTYVVGIRNGDVLATICDSRVSSQKRGHGHNCSLKSGRLFPGCSYAGIGFLQPMRNFISAWKTHCSGPRNVEFWSLFQRFSKEYVGYSATSPFQLLLMVRVSEKSCFYLFDSSTASVTECLEHIVTFGSGKKILDEPFLKFYEESHGSIVEELVGAELPPYLFAHRYCLALMELSKGDRYLELENHGVGGIFHFNYLTVDGDFRQDAALYGIVKAWAERQEIQYFLYRVAFEEMALVVEDGSDQRCTLCIDSAAWPRIETLTRTEKNELFERLMKGSLAQDFYHYLGIGFADPRHSGNGFHHIRYQHEPMILGRSFFASGFPTRFVEAVVTGQMLEFFEEALKSGSP